MVLSLINKTPPIADSFIEHATHILEVRSPLLKRLPNGGNPVGFSARKSPKNG